MICVTGQMECERLIHYALDLQKGEEKESCIWFMFQRKKKEFYGFDWALQHLYDQAVKNGASFKCIEVKKRIGYIGAICFRS